MIRKITLIDRIKFRWKQFTSDKEDVIQDAEWEELQAEDFRDMREQDIWEASYRAFEFAQDEADGIEISIWKMLWEAAKRAVYDRFDRF